MGGQLVNEGVTFELIAEAKASQRRALQLKGSVQDVNKKACRIKNRKELAWREQVAGAQTEMKNEAQDTK